MAVGSISRNRFLSLWDCIYVVILHRRTVLFLWEGISWTPGWPGTFYVTKNGLELLIFQALPCPSPHCWDYRRVLSCLPIRCFLIYPSRPAFVPFFFFFPLRTALNISTDTQEIPQTLQQLWIGLSDYEGYFQINYPQEQAALGSSEHSHKLCLC